MRKRIGNIPFSRLTIANAEQQIADIILSANRCHQVVVANAYSVVLAQNDGHYADICNRADVVLADGMSVVWGSTIFGKRIPERVAGPDFMWSFSNVCAKSGFKVFLLGGASEADLDGLKTNLEKSFPGIQIVGAYSPSFGAWSETENSRIIDMINASGSDIVWVGVSTPKQDKWIDQHRGRLNAKVAIGVGAAFDFHSGKVSRAPKWLQKIGLEWLFRLMQDPQRLLHRYLFGNTIFIAIVIRDFVRGVLTPFLHGSK